MLTVPSKLIGEQEIHVMLFQRDVTSTQKSPANEITEPLDPMSSYNSDSVTVTLTFLAHARFWPVVNN